MSRSSALAHFDASTGRAVVADIGDESLDLVFSAEGLLEHVVSLPLGAARLAGEYLADRPTSRKALKALRRAVRSTLREEVPSRDWRGAMVVGSGGTFRDLAALHLAREGLRATNVHGARVRREEVKLLLQTLHAMAIDDRRDLDGLHPDRAGSIVAGLAVIAELMRRLKTREVQVSRLRFREGVQLEAADLHPAPAQPGEARERSVRHLAERCHYDAPHAEAVRRFALRLFDGVASRLGCAPSDRQLLADAALLHDIGRRISRPRHHKHSYLVIAHADLAGIEPDDQLVMANVARYHRGSPPKKKHREYGALDRDSRRRVKRLASLLRIADGLDHGHQGGVSDLRVEWQDDAIRIALVARDGVSSLSAECRSAHRKSGLLARVAGVPVEMIQPDGTVFSLEQED